MRDEKGVDLLAAIKKSMIAARRESEFALSVDRMVEAHPKSIQVLAEFWAAMYNELNRETKFFGALVQLFDLYLANDNVTAACESFDKLVEIDPYDSRNQQRLDLLQGRADGAFMGRLTSRMANAATHSSTPTPQDRPRNNSSEPSRALLDEVDAEQTLEDLLVQAEIFVQYSLQSKAIERLQRDRGVISGRTRT